MDEPIQLGLETAKLPDNRVANIWVAHGFIATGIKTLDSLNSMKANTPDEKKEWVIARLQRETVGMTCLVQGFELLLATIVQAEGLKVSKKGPQHELVANFNAICGNSKKLTKAIVVIFGLIAKENPVASATHFLEVLQGSFFVARYFGVQKDRCNLKVVGSREARLLAMALATAYPMLRPVELAKSIGFKEETKPPESER